MLTGLIDAMARAKDERRRMVEARDLENTQEAGKMLYRLVIDKAKELAALKEQHDQHMMMNTPTDIDKRIQSQALAHIRKDRISEAQKCYDSAFARWRAAGFPGLDTHEKTS